MQKKLMASSARHGPSLRSVQNQRHFTRQHPVWPRWQPRSSYYKSAWSVVRPLDPHHRPQKVPTWDHWPHLDSLGLGARMWTPSCDFLRCEPPKYQVLNVPSVDTHQMSNNPCGFLRRDNDQTKLNPHRVSTFITTFLQRRNLGDLGFKKKKSYHKNLGILSLLGGCYRQF